MTGGRCARAGIGLAVLATTLSAAPGQPPASHPRPAPAPATQVSARQAPALSVKATLDRYCLGCHNARVRAGGLDFATLDLAVPAGAADAWERVARSVRSGLMPPAGAAQPDAALRRRVAADVEAALDRAAVVAPDPGRAVVHRMNRSEYANAVRDLLALEIDATALLPADETAEGFDTMGGALALSPALFDRYLAAARRISRLAIGDRTIGPSFGSQTYQAAQTTFQAGRMSEDLPFGSRGGTAIRHQFPLDADYVVHIRLARNVVGYVRGLTSAHTLEVRLDGTRVATLTVGGVRQFAPAPLSFTGVILGDPQWEAYAVTADDGLDVRLHAAAGPHVLGVSFVDEDIESEGVLQPALTGLGLGYSEFSSAPSGPWGPAVDAVTIDGPYEPTGPGHTPSRAHLLTCPPVAPDGEACAARLLSDLARRAYRRPVSATEVNRLLAFFRAGAQGDAPFDSGMQTAIERLLVDPNFLFRIERDPPGLATGVRYRVSDLELASRLSFFLWSSIPDEALLAAAERGTLHEPATLDRQVRLMLADPRAHTLVDNFAMQWLGLRSLRQPVLDEEILPEYDGNLREAFLTETRLVIADQIARDQSVRDLLTVPYTFVNERLARHYGIPGVYGTHFRRVAVETTRAGLLGHGSVLTATSYPTRTSPVLRGRWLLDTVLGSPPPPPPPTIPPLPDRDEQNHVVTMRQRTERHRANPVCAGCHAQMDPLGFALENFDAIGRWRTTDDTGTAIDNAGAFPDGATFTGVGGVRSLVGNRSDAFARTLTAKLLTYALGRSVESADMPAVRAIVRDAGVANYRWSALSLGVVRSVPFQMRRVER